MFKISINEIDRNIKKAQGLHEDPIKIAIKKAIQSNCTIEVEDGGETWTGSGFHMGNGYIGTVSHVVPPELIKKDYKMTVTFDGVNKFPARIISSNPDDDTVVIVSNQAKNIIAADLGDSDKIEVGDIIAVIGSPEGWHDTATVGRVANKNQNLGEYAPSPAWNDMIFVDADILQGSSGGEVIATDGKVYGLVMGVTGFNAEIGVGENAVIPINKIKKLISIFNKTVQ